MTVGQLCREMSVAEFVDWLAHDELTAFDREMAQREADMKAKMRR